MTMKLTVEGTELKEHAMNDERAESLIKKLMAEYEVDRASKAGNFTFNHEASNILDAIGATAEEMSTILDRVVATYRLNAMEGHMIVKFTPRERLILCAHVQQILDNSPGLRWTSIRRTLDDGLAECLKAPNMSHSIEYLYKSDFSNKDLLTLTIAHAIDLFV